MKNKLILIFFICGFQPSNASEAPLPKPNFDVFTQLGTECLQEILQANLSGTVEKALLQGIRPADSLNWFVENILFNLLNQQGVDSILVQPQKVQPVFSAKETVLIKFGVMNLGLNYETESHWGFWGKSSVGRHFEVQLFLQIIDQRNGTVIWSGQASRRYADQVNQKQIRNLESSSVRFTQAEFRNQSIYSRFLEPLIIISTTGVIIYLFYSFRSR